VTGPYTTRLSDLGKRARGFVGVLKLAGARDDEVASVLFSIIGELERQANADRPRRRL